MSEQEPQPLGGAIDDDGPVEEEDKERRRDFVWIIPVLLILAVLICGGAYVVEPTTG